MNILKTILLLLSIAVLPAFRAAHVRSSVKDKLPSNWIQLSRTANGYVVYHPCDGATPTVAIKNTTVTINWQLEREQHVIKTITALADTAYQIDCSDAELHITVKWLDKQHTKALWKFGDNESGIIKWVMCPAQQQKIFPVINNPCPGGKIKEKQFLPIDID